MSETLKPCPFCGRAPERTPSAHNNGEDFLGCKNRACIVMPYVTTEETDDLETAWNRRAEPASDVQEGRDAAELQKRISWEILVAFHDHHKQHPRECKEPHDLAAKRVIALLAAAQSPPSRHEGEGEKVLELLRVAGFIRDDKYEQALAIVRSWPEKSPPSRWRTIESPPMRYERVLVLDHQGDHYEAMYQVHDGGTNGHKAGEWYGGRNGDERVYPTHWQPLPPPPAAAPDAEQPERPNAKPDNA